MLSDRDALYNALLNAIKETAKGYQRGLVMAVLDELIYAIRTYSNRETIDVLFERMKERQPRK